MQFQAEVPAELIAALEDDLNTPAAISAHSRDFAKRPRTAPTTSRVAKPLAAALNGLECWSREHSSESTATGTSFTAGTSRRYVRLAVAARNAARAAKNFKEADRIRGELEAMGIMLKDAKDPKTGELVTTWEVAR